MVWWDWGCWLGFDGIARMNGIVDKDDDFYQRYAELDFSKAKTVTEIPALAQLQAETVGRVSDSVTRQIAKDSNE